MITVIVEFKLPQPMTRSQARDTFLSTAPKYQGMPGPVSYTHLTLPTSDLV